MLFLVCICIEPTNTPYVVQTGFAVVGRAFGRSRDAGLELRCTGMRIHHCHHIRKEAFHVHPDGKSPVARFTQKHQHFLCRYCSAHDGQRYEWWNLARKHTGGFREFLHPWVAFSHVCCPAEGKGITLSLKPAWLIESLQNPFQSKVEVRRWNPTDTSKNPIDFRGVRLLVQGLNQSPTKSIENLSLFLMLCCSLCADFTNEMLVKSLKFMTKFLWLEVIWTFASAIPNTLFLLMTCFSS